MRILIFLRDASPNGITTFNRTLAAALRARGHTVTVWASALLHPRMAWALRWAVARHQPDLILTNHFTQARLAHALAQSLGTPWFACMHNGHPDPRMAQWAQLFANASGVITMCESMRAMYSRWVGSHTLPLRGSTVPVLGTRLPLAMPPLPTRTPTKRLTLGYCSRLSGHKGPRCEAWLRAIALLPQAQQHHVLVIGGGSHLKHLRQVAHSLGLAVEFTGMVTDTAPYLDRVDVITGAGYALIEGLVRGAMGVGLGFGGCLGAVTDERLLDAVAVNFGDHCPYPLPEAPAAIAQALQQAIGLCNTLEAAHITQRCRALFAPADIAQELEQFWVDSGVSQA